jgi:hypothetical protein
MSTFQAYLDTVWIHKHLAFVFKSSHPVFEIVALYIGVVCGQCRILISFNAEVYCCCHQLMLSICEMCIANIRCWFA